MAVTVKVAVERMFRGADGRPFVSAHVKVGFQMDKGSPGSTKSGIIIYFVSQERKLFLSLDPELNEVIVIIMIVDISVFFTSKIYPVASGSSLLHLVLVVEAEVEPSVGKEVGIGGSAGVVGAVAGGDDGIVAVGRDAHAGAFKESPRHVDHLACGQTDVAQRVSLHDGAATHVERSFIVDAAAIF